MLTSFFFNYFYLDTLRWGVHRVSRDDFIWHQERADNLDRYFFFKCLKNCTSSLHTLTITQLSSLNPYIFDFHKFINLTTLKFIDAGNIKHEELLMYMATNSKLKRFEYNYDKNRNLKYFPITAFYQYFENIEELSIGPILVADIIPISKLTKLLRL